MSEHAGHAQRLPKRLFKAIKNNNIEQVRICIKQGVNLESVKAFCPDEAEGAFKTDLYPLGHACCLGHEDIMEELLKAGADPNHDCKGLDSGTAMKWAAYEHKITLSMIKTLICYGARVNLKDDDGATVLHYLARGEGYNTSMTGEDLLTAVKILLVNGACCYVYDGDIEDREDHEDITPLHHALRSGNFNLIKLLIKEDCHTGDEIIPEDILTEAALISRVDIFDLLLDAGADKHLKPYALTEPCYLNDHAMIVRILDTCDLDINFTSDSDYFGGMTILHDACCNSKVTVETVKLLLDRGADISTVFPLSGETTLDFAVRGGNIDILNLLLDVDSNRQLTHSTLMKSCSQNNHSVIVRVLEMCDIDINQAMDIPSMPPGFTILHHACSDRDVNTETVKLLIDHGADIRAVAKDGNTVLHFAVMQGNCCKIRHLLAYNLPLNVKNDKNQTPLVTLIYSLRNVWHISWEDKSDDTFLAFKMLLSAGAKFTAELERELNHVNKLNQLHFEHPETLIADYGISSIRSLQEMCRLIIRGSVPVPIDANLEKLPIAKILQEYLDFSEC